MRSPGRAVDPTRHHPAVSVRPAAEDAALSFRKGAQLRLAARCRNLSRPCSGPQIPMTLAFLQSSIRFASGLLACLLLATLVVPAHAETLTRLDAIVGGGTLRVGLTRGLPAVLVR